jgi:membrane protease YdiL (CAAX protease family)
MSRPSSPFLALVGRPERMPLRWLGWLLATGGIFFLSSLLLFALLAAFVEPDRLSAMAEFEPLPEGPLRLLDETRMMFLVAMSLALLAGSAAWSARLMFGRKAWTFVTPARPFRVRLFAAGLILFSLVTLLGLGVDLISGSERLDAPLLDADYTLGSRLVYLTAGGLFVLLAATSEEVVFRGVLLQMTAGLTWNAWALVVINGIIFSAIHLDPAPGAFIARAVSGAVWTWTVLRLAGLELAVGAHFANNVWLLMFAEPFSEAAQVGQDLPLAYLVADVIGSLVFAAAVHFGLRSARVREWIGEPALSLPAAASADGRPPSRDAGS